jgi:hypothetical protein
MRTIPPMKHGSGTQLPYRRIVGLFEQVGIGTPRQTKGMISKMRLTARRRILTMPQPELRKGRSIVLHRQLRD